MIRMSKALGGAQHISAVITVRSYPAGDGIQF